MLRLLPRWLLPALAAVLFGGLCVLSRSGPQPGGGARWRQ